MSRCVSFCLVRLILWLAIILSGFHVRASDTLLWIRYPAISPDGSRVVFSYQGDLFLVPSTGGVAQRLTVHDAYEYMPVWSPDGNQIAYSSNRYGNFDIFIIPAAGGNSRRLTFHSSGEYPNCFSPDGGFVIFSATIQDDTGNVQYPSGILSELYQVSVTGGRVKQILSTPAEMARTDRTGRRIIYHDRKGYENIWRKHHTSSVARDIWIYDLHTGSHTMLTTFPGEDRNPVFSPDERSVYYLSEQSGSFNVWKIHLDNPSEAEQITRHEKHPVRFLTIAGDGALCYGFHGEIYIQRPGMASEKIDIRMVAGEKQNMDEYTVMTSGATEMELSPNGKEIAFIVRGEIFVTSVEYSTTRRITDTPCQERSVSFSPDGRTLLYASERNGSWNLYQTRIVREEEGLFCLSTLLKEETVLEVPEETFQPRYSPDGKEVAYLEEREALRVINLETKTVRTVLEGKYNYSYSDGDQWFEWSPDGKWFLVQYSPYSMFMDEVGLVDSRGGSDPLNLTLSGYSDNRPKWMMKGAMMIWFSDRDGYRSHGSWGAQRDVYGIFFNREAFDRFNLSKEEYELLKEKEKKEKKKKGGDEDENEKDEEDEVIEPVTIDLEGLEDRKMRLTIHSSALADALITPDGEKLYYLSRFEEGYDLWVHKLKEKETRLVMKLKGDAGSLQMDKKGKYLFLFSDGKIIRISTDDQPEKKEVHFKAEMKLHRELEREYLFEHAWRQVKKKFYDPALHGVDWEDFRNEYRPFLLSITQSYDFAEMLSEMLGELNASHTGAGYRHQDENGDQTASLGVFYDWEHEGPGARILEVMDKSPLIQEGSRIRTGHIIEKIDGEAIGPDMNIFPLLNHKKGKKTLVSLLDPETGERWEETVKPLGQGEENELLYQRWVKQRREETERLSGGRIGYVHVRGMNSESFREFYSEVLGRNHDKEALVVDTRFNGGGWLHDDLATMLNGKKYAEFYPRGVRFGHEPMNKWVKPSVVLISESNYSDAHGFPFAYRSLGAGKLIGMPVPGTMTAVWWETLQDNTMYFGIPQVGTRDLEGHYLENQQLEPDILVRQDYDVVVKGRDQQLEKAVEELLQELDR
ncbi:MAG: PD40 domain-containing protein [Bacteroidales bacterium]|nr:PD40 domain-containing protein [Bacteroidales bacterium]